MSFYSANSFAENGCDMLNVTGEGGGACRIPMKPSRPGQNGTRGLPSCVFSGGSKEEAVDPERSPESWPEWQGDSTLSASLSTPGTSQETKQAVSTPRTWAAGLLSAELPLQAEWARTKHKELRHSQEQNRGSALHSLCPQYPLGAPWPLISLSRFSP